MHNLPLYQVDAFTTELFGGNPAAVVPLPEFLSENLMQSIAAENNLSETAFVVIRGRGKFDIRWFTPTKEVRLCGHATLAAAHILYRSGVEEIERLRFRTREAGTINVYPRGEGRYAMDFRADTFKKARSSKKVRAALGGLKPKAVYKGTDDLLVVLKNEAQVANLQPNLHVVQEFKQRGLLVTAPGDAVDFVSRAFYPNYGIDEDPVTGSAHTTLTPYWAQRLGRNQLSAQQISARKGTLSCTLRDDRVDIAGEAVLYLRGEIFVS